MRKLLLGANTASTARFNRFGVMLGMVKVIGVGVAEGEVMSPGSNVYCRVGSGSKVTVGVRVRVGRNVAEGVSVGDAV
jgi:hypothetical protein